MEKRMAHEQDTMNETIAKAVSEAMTAAIQAMAATTERPHNVAGPKIGGPAMKYADIQMRQKTNTVSLRHSDKR